MISSERLFDFYIAQNKRLLDGVREKIDRLPQTGKIALWGCGHHVSMLLANTRFRGRDIAAVYDSDERKAGMLIAGCPIHPFDIRELERLSIDKVVITTYTARNSINAFIRKNGWDTEHFLFLYEPD